MTLDSLTAAAVMNQMDAQQPQWWLHFADQQDLIDAEDVGHENGDEARKRFLRARCEAKVMLVLRSALTLFVKGGL